MTLILPSGNSSGDRGNKPFAEGGTIPNKHISLPILTENREIISRRGRMLGNGDVSLSSFSVKVLVLGKTKTRHGKSAPLSSISSC
jgi:hypothetical protein